MKNAHDARLVERGCAVAAVIVMMLGGVMLGCQFERADASRKMKEGMEEFQKGSVNAAVKAMKEAHEIDTTWAKPALNLAQIYHNRLDEPDNAERYYREAMTRAPGDSRAPYKLGTLLLETDRYDEAASVLGTLVDEHPEHAKGWFRRGESRVAQGEYAEAIADLMRSIQAQPRMKIGEDDAGGAAYHSLGDIYIRFGFYDKALKVYENGVENNPQVARLHHGMGLAQLNLERFEEAEASLKEALAIEPSYTAATFNLAIAQHAMGKGNEAVAGLERYLSRAKDQARIIAAQGLLQKLRERGAQQ